MPCLKTNNIIVNAWLIYCSLPPFKFSILEYYFSFGRMNYNTLMYPFFFYPSYENYVGPMAFIAFPWRNFAFRIFNLLGF